MRIGVVILAYACAALSGAIAIGIVGALQDGPDVLEDILGLTLVFWIIGLIVALPVAVPTIILTESLKLGRWWHFVVPGFGLGLVLLPFLDVLKVDLEFGSAMMILLPTTIAALTYWLVAWRLFPPPQDGA